MDNPSADTENFLDSTRPKGNGQWCERATKGVRHESMFDFSGDRGGRDLVVVKKLGGLASYDVYSLRIELRRSP